ncbi:hypothetical protein SBI_09625 [Streptomyces bingchenggensis BCW-1]|uniref:Beta-galactosidase domain-containing protein n=1 Tax=Streptomyces bingchenggensis (strain BCW-1) TaxID=749414 RepID=D7C9N1_STRBB|nr:hypothetical protein SBI_09625 [Streptomyces bingchenggensis BCW-1]
MGPGEEGDIELPADVVRDLRKPTALGLTLTVRTREPSPWAEAGTELALLQVRPGPPPGPCRGAVLGRGGRGGT